MVLAPRSACAQISARAPDPFLLVDRLDAELARLRQFRAGARPGDDEIGLGGDRAGHLGAQPLGDRLGLVARHPLERPGEDDGLAGERMAGRDRRHRLDRHFLQERVERGLVALLGEEVGDRLRHNRPDAFDRREFLGSARAARGGAETAPSRRNGGRGDARWSRRHGARRARTGTGSARSSAARRWRRRDCAPRSRRTPPTRATAGVRARRARGA